MTYLSLDPGIAHTGIAISHEGILAEPLTTIFEKDTDALVGKLIPLIARHNPEEIIIGEPPYGPLKKVAFTLKEKLSSVYDKEIILFPEDLSTKQAKNTLSQTKKSHQEQKQKEHQTAAAFILQNYLDSK